MVSRQLIYDVSYLPLVKWQGGGLA